VKVGVARERSPGERRVALVPEAVGRIGEQGFEVLVETGAGAGASFSDAAYVERGATIVEGFAQLAATADAVLKVQKPSADERDALREGTVLIGLLQPLTDPEGIERLEARGVIAFAMESIPRITRAQPMDALSSQSTVAGYKAAVMAAGRLPRFFPLLMTAAGTVTPAKVLVLGAGVAGLQAIATAHRLGAVVAAFDTRPAVKEQVESLGASFLAIEVEGEETTGGYAAELSEEQHRREQELIARHVAESDVVITTALVPGKPAPRLITREAVAAMRPGSVVVDLAAEAGGNCELTEPGAEVEVSGVTDEPAEHDGGAREPALLAQRLRAPPPPRAGRRARARLRGRDHGRRLRHQPHAGGARLMPSQLIVELTILILAIFLGVEVISKVPTLLHTPLMSGTNAIHGIVLVGAIIVAGLPDQDTWVRVVSLVAVALGTINVVGGFVVTDRMLEMFKKREPNESRGRD
jgi:NAD(P) transhydrogenase subunit alpha